MSRNVCLKFDEWELINNELSNQEWHSFKIDKRYLEDWKYSIKHYHKNGYTHGEPQFKFERVGIYPEIEQVKSARALNILCRENWRSQDMFYVMKHTHNFIGFILTHCDDVNTDTTLEEWEDIRIRMKNVIDESCKNIWFSDDLIELYHSLWHTSSSSDHND